MILTTHLCVVLSLNISKAIPLLPVYAFITSALPFSTTTTYTNYSVSVHKCLCLLVVLITTLSLVHKNITIFLSIICYRSGLLISSCAIILFNVCLHRTHLQLSLNITIMIILGQYIFLNFIILVSFFPLLLNYKNVHNKEVNSKPSKYLYFKGNTGRKFASSVSICISTS